MIEGLIEIRIRQFYTSKEADVAPSSIAIAQRKDTGESPDWDKLIEHLVTATAEQLTGAPFTDIRPMTKDEVDRFRLDEAGEDSGR